MKTNIDAINFLVRLCFGFLYNGDWQASPEENHRENQKLGLIARPSLGRILSQIPLVGSFFTPDCFPVGTFLNENGSALRVLKRYALQAKRYAEIYQQNTGTKVTIEYR